MGEAASRRLQVGLIVTRLPGDSGGLGAVLSHGLRGVEAHEP